MFDFIINADEQTVTAFIGGLAMIGIFYLACIKVARGAEHIPAMPRDELVRNKQAPRYFDKSTEMDPIEYRADPGNQQATEATMEGFISVARIYDLPTSRGPLKTADNLLDAINKAEAERTARLAIDAKHPAGRRV